MHDAVGQKLGVNPQIVFTRKGQQNRLGRGPQAQLQGRPVIDQAGDLPRNDIGRRHFRLVAHGQQGFVMLDNHVDIVDMDKAAPQHPRHSGIDLGNDHIGRLGRRKGDIHGNPQAHPSEVIRRADLDQSDVDRQLAAFKQARDRREIDGGDKAFVFGEPSGFGRSQVKGPDIQTLILGFVGNQRQGEWFQGTKAGQFQDWKNKQRIRKFLHQTLGFAARRTDENPLPRSDHTDGRFCGFLFEDVVVSPVRAYRHQDSFFKVQCLCRRSCPLSDQVGCMVMKNRRSNADAGRLIF